MLIKDWCFAFCRVLLAIKEELFSVSCSASEDVQMKPVWSTARTWTSQRAIPYHTTSYSVYKLGRAGQGRPIAVQDRLGIGQRVVSNLIVHHLFCLGLISLFFLTALSTQVLPFAHSPPHPTRVEEWASHCLVPSWWMELSNEHIYFIVY